MRRTFIIAAGFAALSSLSGQAQAQANRTFVSGLGSDSNPCSLSAPCRSFAGAITKTNSGGEIVVLDSAGYGSVTITKSISINAPDGIEGGVTTASATDAIVVTVGASDVVNLRGLTLLGGGVGTNGVNFNGLGALNIQNCAVRGFTGTGLALDPTGSAAFNVSDTIIANVGFDGVEIKPTGSGTVTALFNHVQAIGAGNEGLVINGANATGTIDATIANSTASNNGAGVVTLSAAAQATTQVMVVNSVIANNAIGVSDSSALATTYLAKNTISGNTTAFSVGGSPLLSFGDNDIKGNGNDGPAISLVQTK